MEGLSELASDKDLMRAQRGGIPDCELYDLLHLVTHVLPENLHRTN